MGSPAGKTVCTSLLGPCGQVQGLSPLPLPLPSPNLAPVLPSFFPWFRGQGPGVGLEHLLGLWLLFLRNSNSSTVHTAPFSLSTRTKHLCRLRLWRMAFCGGRASRPGAGGAGGQSCSEVSSPHQNPTSCPLPTCLQAQPQAHLAWPSTLVASEALPATATSRGAHLPGGRVVSEEGEHACEPVIDLVECPLLLRSLQDGLGVRGCGVRGAALPKLG